MDHQGAVLVDRGEYSVIDCRNCGFAHLSPIPDSKTLEQYYFKRFYGETKSDYISRSEKDSAWWRLQYFEWLDLIAAACRSGGRRILDIGCGPGFFLSAVREMEWETHGIDASSQAIAYARDALQLEVQQGFVVDHLPGGTYDAVLLNLVLEHIATPAKLLKTVWDGLHPGGVVCIVVPNDFSTIQLAAWRELKKPEWWVAVPDHINYFSYDSLERLLGRTGFTPVARTTDWPMEFFLLMGDDYAGNDTLGQVLHKKRVRMDLTLGAHCEADRRRFFQSLAGMGWGRDAVVIARK